MSSNIRLKLTQVEFASGMVVIKHAEIIDAVTGDTIRNAEINKSVAELFQGLEVNLNDYAAYQLMKKKNPKLKEMVKKLGLYING